MYIITNDPTNKCVHFDTGSTNKSDDRDTVFGDMVIRLIKKKQSTSLSKYANGDFDLTNIVRVITTDHDRSFIEMDLKNNNWALSTAPTVAITDAASLYTTLLGYFAAYK
jgi:hypothetical protein